MAEKKPREGNGRLHGFGDIRVSQVITSVAGILVLLAGGGTVLSVRDTWRDHLRGAPAYQESVALAHARLDVIEGLLEDLLAEHRWAERVRLQNGTNGSASIEEIRYKEAVRDEVRAAQQIAPEVVKRGASDLRRDVERLTARKE